MNTRKEKCLKLVFYVFTETAKGKRAKETQGKQKEENNNNNNNKIPLPTPGPAPWSGNLASVCFPSCWGSGSETHEGQGEGEKRQQDAAPTFYKEFQPLGTTCKMK